MYFRVGQDLSRPVPGVGSETGRPGSSPRGCLPGRRENEPNYVVAFDRAVRAVASLNLLDEADEVRMRALGCPVPSEGHEDNEARHMRGGDRPDREPVEPPTCRDPLIQVTGGGDGWSEESS